MEGTVWEEEASPLLGVDDGCVDTGTVCVAEAVFASGLNFGFFTYTITAIPNSDTTNCKASLSSLIRSSSEGIRETTSHHSQPVEPIGAKGYGLLSFFSLRVWRGSGHFNWTMRNRVDLGRTEIGRVSLLCFSFERKQIHCTVFPFGSVECVSRICGL